MSKLLYACASVIPLYISRRHRYRVFSKSGDLGAGEPMHAAKSTQNVIKSALSCPKVAFAHRYASLCVCVRLYSCLCVSMLFVCRFCGKARVNSSEPPRSSLRMTKTAGRRLVCPGGCRRHHREATVETLCDTTAVDNSGITANRRTTGDTCRRHIM